MVPKSLADREPRLHQSRNDGAPKKPRGAGNEDWLHVFPPTSIVDRITDGRTVSIRRGRRLANLPPAAGGRPGQTPLRRHLRDGRLPPSGGFGRDGVDSPSREFNANTRAEKVDIGTIKAAS